MKHDTLSVTKPYSGYTLVEVIVVLFIFTTMFLIMLNVFQSAIRALNVSRAKIVATDMSTEQMEIIRNLAYANVGTVNGSPQGTLADTIVTTRSNIHFTITTVIQYVDDPFDGCVGSVTGEPTKSQCADGTIVDKIPDTPANNGNPADYKKATITVTWDPYYTGNPIELSTIVAPKGLEGNTTKGFLWVQVFNASGAGLADADVHITNATLTPAYDKTFQTDSFGNVLLLDLEPAADSYVIKVSKSGYSTDRTCSVQAGGTSCSDAAGNPDPIVKNITINMGQLEKASFAIDQLSSLTINSYDNTCAIKQNINFTLSGKKTISNPPSSILKNVFTFSTNAQGQWSKTDLEWDLYDLIVNTAGYFISGINHDLALDITPNTHTTLNVLLSPATAHALLLTVKDTSNTTLSNASVQLTKSGYDETKITGHTFARQTDWSGGTDPLCADTLTKYCTDNSHVDVTTTSGQISLHKNAPTAYFTETFDTTAYYDSVDSTADWNTSDGELKLTNSSGNYPLNTPEYGQSTKINAQNGRIISATIDATQSPNGQLINYLLSADGGIHYEPVTLSASHSFTNVGNDLRFKVELSTTDDSKTPTVQDVTISYLIEYYDGSGELTSSVFDLGSPADFTTISWVPSAQIAETGNDSVKFQIATNNDNATWDFKGPDGTSGTYYTTNNAIINGTHNGQQYVRYKIILTTADVYYTPNISEIRIGYSLSCLPAGQVYFDNLEHDTYTINVSMAGYQTISQSIDVNGYTKQEIKLSPL